ncbi:MAG TPA: ATP-binding protein, partial [Roseateles sp.]|nr:ATP-binding protein [Roseateles sp.]
HAQVRDERGRTWDLTADPVAGPAADGDRVVLAAREVTRMVELQESLRRSETLSAMGTLVAGVAHEVRNPLFGISANLDAFEARFGSQAEYQETIELLRSELDRLVLLMNDLLDYGRPVYESPSEEPLDAVVAQAIRACAGQARRAEVALVNEVPPALGACVMDRRRIAQVLQNLLENAIQHSPPGGSVALAVRRDGFTVRDQGPGLPAEQLSRIFERFWRGPERRDEGAGLGLAICMEIATAHGWRLRARAAESGLELGVAVDEAARDIASLRAS